MEESDDIEIHLDQNGVLELNCGQQAFARIVRIIQDELEDPDLEADKVKLIEVYSTETPNASGWRDRLALLGCGVAAALILASLAANAIQIFLELRG